MPNRLFALALLAMASTLASAQSQQSLYVFVQDAFDDAPLAGATVDLYQEDQLVQTAVTDAAGQVTFSVSVAVGREDLPEGGFRIGTPYPNPATGSTALPFDLDRGGPVSVTVLDLLGRSVARTSEALPAGRHEVRVDLSGLPAGTYFVRFAQAGRASAALPVTLAVPSSGRPGLTFASGREQAGTAPKAAAGPNDYELRVSADGYTVGPLAVTVQAEMEVTIGMNKVEPNSIGMELVRIPAGTFLMGSESGSSNELPVHQVTLTGDFWLGRYEVTQGEYFAVTGLRPSWFAGDDRLPVEQVSSYDAVAFANALSSAEDLAPCYDGSGNVIGGDPYACEGYRLPTEAEWEYATRAGTTTEYSFGDDSGQLGDYAWHSGNSSSRTHAVGGKLPNPWGLYDVHGNVWEWLHDWYGGSYYDSSPWENPPGPTAGSYRVVRGGSWSTGAYGLRSAYRYNDNPSARSGYGGFRLARAAR